MGKKKKSKKKKKRKSKSPARPVEEEAPHVTIDTASEVSEGDLDEEYFIEAAHTALILPFVYRPIAQEKPTHVVARQLLKRQVAIPERDESRITFKRCPLWKLDTNLPKEMADLNPLFQQIFGWERKSLFEHSSARTWSCQRLTLTDEVMNELFKKPLLHVIQEHSDTPYEVEIECIELVIYPLGSAMLIIHVNWLPPFLGDEISSSLSLRDMSTLLFISKYKHMIKGACHGWSFGDDIIPLDVLPKEVIQSLGDSLIDARYGNKTTSLGGLGNWLIAMPGEDSSNPPMRLDYSRHAFHQTTVVINREPPQGLLQDYLFHFRHAYGQKNRPPIYSEATLGRVLVWRLNRYIGMSKEGNVSISWGLPDSSESVSFETHQWHMKFQGIFLLLTLHALGEKSVLYELSDVAAFQAETLQFTNEVNLEEMKNWRNKLRHLASLVVRYTLAMSSNDCGGTSEYSDFFTNLRSVFGIQALREELSNELKDVLAVVESNYLEEERRQRDVNDASRRKAYEKQKELEIMHSRQKDAFEIVASVLSSFTLPFVVVAGIFGMNNHTLPVDISFWKVMVWTFVASILLLIGLLVLRNVLRRKLTRNQNRELEEFGS